jgi:hypothetical protein
MKKFIVAMCLILLVCTGVLAEDSVICGKDFKVVIEYDIYILQFLETSSSLPCTGGYVNMFWQDRKEQYSFFVYDDYYVQIFMMANNVSQNVNFMFRNGKLVYIDPRALTFTEF